MAAIREALQIASAIEKLGVDGYAVSTGILPLDLVASLAAEQRRREGVGELVGARTGRGAGQAVGAAQRQTQSSWFSEETAAERHYLAFAERMRVAINRRFFWGCSSSRRSSCIIPLAAFTGGISMPCTASGTASCR